MAVIPSTIRAEKRRDPRRKSLRLYFSPFVPVLFSLNGHRPFHPTESTLSNVSKGGACVKTKVPAEVGESIFVRSSIISKNPMKGKISWVQSLDDDDTSEYKYQVGVEFIEKIQLSQKILDVIDIKDKKDGRRTLKPNFNEARSFASRLENWKKKSVYVYFRVSEGKSKPLNFASNDILDLSHHSEVMDAAKHGIEEYGIGTSAASILAGTRSVHQEVQKAIAEFKGCEDAIITTSGYVANLGALNRLANKETIVFIDEKSHASMFHGCEHARCLKPFQHNNLDDLVDKISRYPLNARKMILTEGVFSMDGDKGLLREIKRIADQFNAFLFVDDGHGVGIYGKNGTGVDEEEKVRGKCDIVTGSFNKAIGSTGGFIAGSRDMMSYLKHFSIPLMFTTALSASNCLAILKSLNIINREKERRNKIISNSKYLRESLKKMGFDTSTCNSHLIPVIFRDETVTYRVTEDLEKMGIIVSPVSRPAVKRNEARIRLAVRASHTLKDIENVLNAFHTIKKKYVKNT